MNPIHMDFSSPPQRDENAHPPVEVIHTERVKSEVWTCEFPLANYPRVCVVLSHGRSFLHPRSAGRPPPEVAVSLTFKKLNNIAQK